MIARPEAGALQWGFSTIGWPEATLPEALALAREFQIRAVELRSLEGTVDLPRLFAERGWTPERVAELNARHGTRLVVAGASFKLTSRSEAERAEFLAFCEWANALEIPFVRAFGGGKWGEPFSDADYETAASNVEWWREQRRVRGWRIELLLETHDGFSGSAPCLELNRRLAEPVLLLWDSHHTWRLGGEAPAETWERLGPWVRHVHIKDSVDRPSARHPYTYVLPGEGQMPLAETVAVLREAGFAGCVSLEWERLWHPYLPPLREALVALRRQAWFSPTKKTAAVSASIVGLGTGLVEAGEESVPGGYAWWRAQAEALLQPLAALMRPGKADLPLSGPASNHGAQADRLESFARPCLLAAHWLASEPAPREKLSRAEIAEWFRRGLVLGTDPRSAEYWGPTANHHQHTVEMAALTLALQIAREQLWEPLASSERRQIAEWFGSVRGAGLHRNNHMFFAVLPLAFLEQEGFGREADRPVMRYLLDVLEGMALGGGWFLDGMNETVDYYAGYAWGYYGLWWAKLYGHTDPARARRWKQWAVPFLKDYAHFFAASGENPPFGRSLAYRFAAGAPFALAEFCEVSAIPPGLARRLCTRNLEFFLRHPIQQAQGALSLGWTDEFPAAAEAYSCAGSPYWAAKGFAPLLLPPSHRFWRAKAQALPAEEKDFSRAIPQAGLVVRAHAGDVEVLNNANGICVSNVKFGTWKWGKLSYRSGFGFEIAPAENRYPLDAALTADFGDGAIHGRQQMHPVAVTVTHCASVYGLGDRFSQNHVSVETRLWWRGGWQLHWHHIVAHRPAVLRLGTYSLPLPDGLTRVLEVNDRFARAANAERGVAIQPLHGFAAVRLHESPPDRRTHLYTWHSLVLVAETERLSGAHDLVALVWAGLDEKESAPWQVASSKPGRLVLRHEHHGSWEIRCAGLPALAPDPTPKL
ncbi:MAG: DUF2264 domain-containing protein [Verrucomicrobiales bacterium]|nr:DUF2264 domain-containing protein [Verrucomicrobiales bacterium]